MRFRKLVISIFIFIVFLNFNQYIFADEIEEENIDTSEIESIYLEDVSSFALDVPLINSRYAVVFDRSTGNVLYGKNEDAKCKMASTTKIMSSIVVLEHVGNLEEKVKVSSNSAGTGGSRLGLKTDDEITVGDLLYGLLLCSGNDAAVALAEYTAGSIEEFAKLMNEKAVEIGLTNTHFVTPHGLDEEEHYTTALELAKITDYALENKKFKEIVGTRSYTVNINRELQKYKQYK